MTPNEHLQYIVQALQEQADDMFALYQLAQLVAEVTDLDDVARLALQHLVRISESPYAALFVQVGQERRLDLVALRSSDAEGDAFRADDIPRLADGRAALNWFRASGALSGKGCLSLAIDVGRELPGLILLAPPSQDGFSHYQRNLLSTMSREVARALLFALARADLKSHLRRVEQMQADFVATVSHELRAPLARIRGFVDSLTHLTLTPQQQRLFIEGIGQSTTQLTHLVATILSFSQLDEGRTALSIQPTDLVTALKCTVQDLDHASVARLELDVPRICVQADSDRLVQILTNLLLNALKYSPPDTIVRVRGRSRPAQGVAWLTVRDRGLGIPREDQPYLFTRFFRASNVRESSVAGTGLGLYITKRLIEEQGGMIRLRSLQGIGTVVGLHLPLA